MPHRILRDFPLLSVDSKRCNSPSSRPKSGVHSPLMPINLVVEMRDLLIFLCQYPLLQFSLFLSFDLTSVFHYINISALFSFCLCSSDFAVNLTTSVFLTPSLGVIRFFLIFFSVFVGCCFTNIVLCFCAVCLIGPTPTFPGH